jgi:hypothetical protein
VGRGAAGGVGDGEAMTPPGAEAVTKLDAARRQLRTAVTLFFQDGDRVSIRTLAAAAHQVLSDLLKHAGKKTRLERNAEDVVKPEYRREYRDAIRRAQNFFKHADKEPNPTAVVEFDPRQTHYILLDCFEAYMLLTGRSMRELWLFFGWFALENPDLLLPSPMKDAVLAVVGDGSAPHRNRSAFMAAFNRHVGPLPQFD